MKWIDRLDGLITAIVNLGAVAVVLTIFVSVVDSPSRVEGSSDDLGLIRVLLVIGMGSVSVLFGYLALAAIVASRETAERLDVAYLAMTIGFTVSMASSAVLFIGWPSTRFFVIPAPILVGMYGGFALTGIGALPTIVSGFAAAVRRRDRGFLAALLLAALLVLMSALRRR